MNRNAPWQVGGDQASDERGEFVTGWSADGYRQARHTSAAEWREIAIRGKEAIRALRPPGPTAQGKPNKGEVDMNKTFFRKTIATVLLFACAYMLAMSAGLTALQRAEAADGVPGTLDEYWNGNAEWVYLRKDTFASTGFPSYFDGTQVKMMSDGTWYLFNRKYVTDSACSGGTALETQVRRSTDKGVTWSAPTTIIPHVPGTPYSCFATDGDAWYNAAENKWHYLFQCLGGSGPWQGCMLSRDGADPMGPFTIAPAGGNPVITPGEIWNQICNVSSDDCSSLAGGSGRVFDEGTFNIFDYDGTHYWIGFHGYDGVRGYRGIAKSSDFQTWIAGNPTQGVPADAVHDRNDSQGWRESWNSGGSIGAGAGSMIREGSYYYHLVESSDINLGCTAGQNWDYGLYRSTSLTNTTWSQYPQGNPIIYSSKSAESGGAIPPCNVQYAGLVKDPTDGFIYLAYGRRSSDPNYDGLYWYRLEKSSNLLLNANLWKANTDNWNRLGPNTNWVAYRLPNNSPDGTPYLATNCGGVCSGTNSIYQDVTIPGGTAGTAQFGGKFLSEGSAGSVDLVIRQMNAAGTIVQTDILPIATGTSWASYGGSVPLLATATKLRYEFYLRTDHVTFRADDMYIQTSFTDTIAPTSVTDLRSSSVTSGTVALTWTAPGNDGNAGTAAAYDIRYSNSPITSANWASAMQAVGEPAPAVGGNSQSFTVSGLSPGTDYYFAVKTSDAAGNVSGLSNGWSVKTVGSGSLFSDAFADAQRGPSWFAFGGSWSETGGTLTQTSLLEGDPKKMLIGRTGFDFPSSPLTITAKVRVDAWTGGDFARAGVSLFNDMKDGGGYNLVFHNNHSTVQFLDDGVAWGPSYPFTWSSGVWYWFKLKADGGTLYGKVWADGATEPATWPYSWMRSGRSGVPGLNGGAAKTGTGSSSASFDDVVVQ
ncbi:fibronectin type III domain-containing protein [Paenibacillus mendelii]|nr:fibronectin type III domain-containing protein [Paenibacillus mendelii]